MSEQDGQGASASGQQDDFKVPILSFKLMKTTRSLNIKIDREMQDVDNKHDTEISARKQTCIPLVS